MRKGVKDFVTYIIKHVHSPEVIVVLDPRYDLSYKALYISTCSIALNTKVNQGLPKCWQADGQTEIINP